MIKKADSIVKAITKLENDFHKQLQDFFSRNAAAFKQVRRALPKTGTKFDWRLGTHKVNTALGTH